MNPLYLKPVLRPNRMWMLHSDDIANGTTLGKRISTIPNYFFEFGTEENIIAINAGLVAGANGICFMFSPAEKIKEYLLTHANSETKILFDDLHEGDWFQVIDTIYKIIEGTFIKPAQCYFFTGGLNVPELYNKYMESNKDLEHIKIYTCNAWEPALLSMSELKQITYEVKIKEKTFLCFNRMLRSHRIMLLGLLYSRNLVKDAHYSYFADSTYNSDPAPINGLMGVAVEYMTEDIYNIAKEHYFKHEAEYPLKLNIEWQDNVNYVKVSDLELFQSSYLSLVTETMYFPVQFKPGLYDWNSVFFSEKIFKPILMKHPFILVGSPHSLKYLRKLGYKTFSPFINESYDDIENHGDRLVAIVNEVERLNRNTPEQWIEWQNNIKEIVEHNHNVIRNRKKHQYAVTRPDYNTEY